MFSVYVIKDWCMCLCVFVCVCVLCLRVCRVCAVCTERCLSVYGRGYACARMYVCELFVNVRGCVYCVVYKG